jgi:hypothetical protein
MTGLKRAGQVLLTEEITNTAKILTMKHPGKRPLERWRRLNNKIKINLREKSREGGSCLFPMAGLGVSDYELYVLVPRTVIASRWSDTPSRKYDKRRTNE